MTNKYLTIEDLDTHIIHLLDPPTVLSLSEVNKHYADLLENSRLLFNAVKFDLEKICAYGAVWVYDWMCGSDLLSDLLDSRTIQFVTESAQLKKYGSIYKCVDEFREYMLYAYINQNDDNWNEDAYKILHHELAFILSAHHGHLHMLEYISEKYSEDMDPSYYQTDYVLDISLRCACNEGHLAVAQYIHGLYVDEIAYFIVQHIFSAACKRGRLVIVRWLIETFKCIDVHTRDEYAFWCACMNGQLDVAKYLVDVGLQTNNPIDIHSDQDKAIISAAEAGHLDTLQWLIELGEKTQSPFDLHGEGCDIMLLTACIKGHKQIAHYLIELGKKSYGEYDLEIYTEYLPNVDIMHK